MWRVLDLIKDEDGCIRKDEYIVMNLKLAKVLPAFLSCPPPRVFDSLEVAVRLTF